MVRIKRGNVARKRRKTVLKLAKGYKLPFLNARNTITAGPEPRTKIIDNICPKTCQFIIKTVSI